MPFRARCNPTCLIRRQNAFLAIKRSQPIAGRAIRYGMVQDGSIIHRYNSTSSLFSPFTSFFSRAKGLSPPSPEQAASEFHNSLSNSQIDPLHSAYSIITSSPLPGQYLSQDDLYDAMAVLADSKSINDLDLLRRIYEDVPNLFNYPITSDHQNLLIKALCNNALMEDAFSLAETLDPQIVDWRLLLRSASTQNPSLVDPIIPYLKHHSSLDQGDISLIIRSIRSSHSSSTPSAASAKLESLLDDVDKKGISLDPSTEAELMRLYISLGELEKANEIVSQWKKKNVHSPGLWNAIVELQIARSDSESVEETVGRMREKGYNAPQKALTFLALQNLQSNIDSRSTVGFSEIVGSIESAERICGNSASSDVWAESIRLYLSEIKSHESLDVAIGIYNEVLSRGIEVSAELARNIIIPLCNTRSKSPSRLNDAMRIYEDYITSPKAFSDRREKQRFSTVYQYLLMSCSRSKPPYSIQIAIKLLSDMRVNQITLVSKNLISLLILLMKSSEDHQSAFNLYAHFYAISSDLIDEQGYKAILTNYLNLSWEKSPYPPPELFIAILKDMNKNGYQPDSHILASLLKQYGHQATKLRRKSRSNMTSSAKTTDSMAMTISNQRNDELTISVEEQIDNLGQSIRDIHTLIKLDPLISPDIPLLGSLMDAYGRVGAFSECFEVWDELVQRRSREPLDKVQSSYAASINVILDACGWSYSLKRGKKIWLWCNKFNLIWEKKHYDSYIEFLCRNSQFNDASSTLLDEMGNQRNNPEPDKESVRIILKFGRRDAELGKAKEDIIGFVERLKVERKDLYDQVKEEGELEGLD